MLFHLVGFKLISELLQINFHIYIYIYIYILAEVPVFAELEEKTWIADIVKLID